MIIDDVKAVIVAMPEWFMTTALLIQEINAGNLPVIGIFFGGGPRRT
jgi:hypothetical protein